MHNVKKSLLVRTLSRCSCNANRDAVECLKPAHQTLVYVVARLHVSCSLDERVKPTMTMETQKRGYLDLN